MLDALEMIWHARILDVIHGVLLLQHPSDLYPM